MRRAARTILDARARKYDYCLNLIGDVRECFLGWLIHATWTVGPIWQSGHLFKQKITDRLAPSFLNLGVVIPAENGNYYDSLTYFAAKLGISDLDWKAGPKTIRRIGHSSRIALHPGASHPSRHWPTEKWKQLMSQLYADGNKLFLIGAPEESKGLQDSFAEEIQSMNITMLCGDLANLSANLSNIDLLVGMDSLSVHLAYAHSVPAVVLNGSSDPRVLAPPGSVGLSAGHLCADFPCNYKYPCRNQAHEFVCCRGIETNEVEVAVAEIAHGPHGRGVK